MSEYQHYEWQTVDHPLTSAEQRAISELSSHIQVTSTRAIVTYQWGDFKHDPLVVLSKYFDAHLYAANWGSRQLAFRFPKDALDETAIEPYCDSDHITFETHGKYQILDISLGEEEGDWVEAEGVLAGLAHLRDNLLDGDYRILYLAWLKAISIENPVDFVDSIGFTAPELGQPEPPVPPGLGHLTTPLKLFADFFEIDAHLIAAAAQTSSQPPVIHPDELHGQIAQLSREEADNFLLRIATGEPGQGAALKKRLRDFNPHASGVQPAPARTVGQLFQAAKQEKTAAARRQAAQKQREHIAEMKSLSACEPQVWQQVETFLQTRTASSYASATELLIKLKQLSQYLGSQSQFDQRLSTLHDRVKDRAALIRRWKENGLIH